MVPTYARLLARLDRERQTFLAELSELEPALLNFRESERSWSILQVAHHLELADRGVLVMMRDPRALAGKLRRRPRNLFGYAVLRLVLASGVRVPMPAKVRELATPPESGDLDVLRSRWHESAEELSRHFSLYTDEDRNRLVAIHPAGGPMTPKQVLHFLLRHFRHHMKQVARIRKAAGPGQNTELRVRVGPR